MYTYHYPNIIEIILGQNEPQRMGDTDCRALASDINRGFLVALIELLPESSQHEHIFLRLKKTFHESKQNHDKKRNIIWWYTQLFKNFAEDLIDKHQDIFDNLIDNLDFT